MCALDFVCLLLHIYICNIDCLFLITRIHKYIYIYMCEILFLFVCCGYFCCCLFLNLPCICVCGAMYSSIVFRTLYDIHVSVFVMYLCMWCYVLIHCIFFLEAKLLQFIPIEDSFVFTIGAMCALLALKKKPWSRWPVGARRRRLRHCCRRKSQCQWRDHFCHK